MHRHIFSTACSLCTISFSSLSLPAALGAASSSLTHPTAASFAHAPCHPALYLDNSGLAGSLPEEVFWALPKLSYFSAQSNGLTGTLPGSAFGGFYGELENDGASANRLAHLNLGWNDLEGSLPTQIGLLAATTFIGLDSNHITGPIPTQMARLSFLHNFELNRNGLSGSIPTQMGLVRKKEKEEDGRTDSLSGLRMKCTQKSHCCCFFTRPKLYHNPSKHAISLLFVNLTP
jgi:hypothetical protein